MSIGPGYLLTGTYLAIWFWSLCPQRYSKANWTQSQTTIPWWPCWSREEWTRSFSEIPSNLNQPLSLWAYKPISSSLVSQVPAQRACLHYAVHWLRCYNIFCLKENFLVKWQVVQICRSPEKALVLKLCILFTSSSYDFAEVEAYRPALEKIPLEKLSFCFYPVHILKNANDFKAKCCCWKKKMETRY